MRCCVVDSTSVLVFAMISDFFPSNRTDDFSLAERFHGQALVQSKQDPSYGGALQKAKDTLNNMMEVSPAMHFAFSGNAITAHSA